MLLETINLLQSGLTAAAPASIGEELWFGASDSAWAEGQEATDLFVWIWWFCVIWFVFLMGLVGYFCVKYRRRKGVAPERSAAHNTPLEIAWTVIPTLFLVYIFFRGFHGYLDMVVAEGNAEQIELTAQKWNWVMTYPNGVTSAMVTKIDEGQTIDYPIFVVPEDFPIELTMQSTDVIHSFWVPDLRQKFDVFPNRYTKFAFRVDKLTEEDKAANNDPEFFPGGFRDHVVFCAEYCGDSHAEMAAILRVATRTDYETWKESGGVNAAELAPVELGALLYKVKGCAACHSVDGSPNTGPSWKDLYGADVSLTNGSTVKGDENYIRESILVPGAKVHEGYPNQMPSYQGKFNNIELRGMIAYIRSLSENATPEELEADKVAPGESEGFDPEEAKTTAEMGA